MSCVACVLALAGQAAVAGSAMGEGAHAGIDMRIVVPAFVRVSAQSDPAGVPIGAEDISRGYLDVEDAGSVVLTSNSPHGFAVLVAFDDRVVSRIAVRIEGQAIEASQGSALQVQSPKVVAKTVRLGYRLFLAPGAAAGTYQWPVRLRFVPAMA